MSTRELSRMVRMFVDCEECGHGPCVVSQVIVHVAQYSDGTLETVITDAEEPSRCLRSWQPNKKSLTTFLEFASVLNGRGQRAC